MAKYTNSLTSHSGECPHVIPIHRKISRWSRRGKTYKNPKALERKIRRLINNKKNWFKLFGYEK